MPKNNNDEIIQDELDLEQEQSSHVRSRDDELERERTVDGEEIYQPEQEEPVEEEAYDPTQDEEHDEYYEDMFEEDWEEVEAKEQAKKEKEEEKAKKKAKAKEKEKRIKARREEQRKKEELLRQEEARRREREQLEADSHKDKKDAPAQEEVPVVTVPGQAETAAQPTQAAEPTQTVVSEPTVSQQADAKQNVFDGQNVDQDSLYEEQKKEAFNRQMEEQERAKDAAHKNVAQEQTTIPTVEPTTPSTSQQEAPTYIPPQSEQQTIEPGHTQQNTVHHEESKPIIEAESSYNNGVISEEPTGSVSNAVSLNEEKVLEQEATGSVVEPLRNPVHEGTAPIQDETKQTTTVEPVVEDAKTASVGVEPERVVPVAPIVPEAAGSNADFHQQMVEGVENAEYSREHQKQQYEQREQSVKEEVAQQEQSKVTPTKEDDIPFVTPHVAGDSNASKSVDVFSLPEEEKPFYNHAGIPTSVVDAAVLASVAPKAAHEAIVSETIVPDISETVVSEATPKATPKTQNEEPFARFENDFPNLPLDAFFLSCGHSSLLHLCCHGLVQELTKIVNWSLTRHSSLCILILN